MTHRGPFQPPPFGDSVIVFQLEKWTLFPNSSNSFFLNRTNIQWSEPIPCISVGFNKLWIWRVRPDPSRQLQGSFKGMLQFCYKQSASPFLEEILFCIYSLVKLGLYLKVRKVWNRPFYFRIILYRISTLC